MATPNAARCSRASLRRKLVSLPGLCPGNASFPHTRPLPFVILPYSLRSKVSDYPKRKRHLAWPDAARCGRAGLRRKLVSLPGLCPGNASFPRIRSLPFVIPYSLRSKLTASVTSEWTALHSKSPVSDRAFLICGTERCSKQKEPGRSLHPGPVWWERMDSNH